jgi:hypothetical protein
VVSKFEPVALSLEEFGVLLQNKELKWFPGSARVPMVRCKSIGDVSRVLSDQLNMSVVESKADCISLYSKSSSSVHVALLAKLDASGQVSVQLKCTDSEIVGQLVEEIKKLKM